MKVKKIMTGFPLIHRFNGKNLNFRKKEVRRALSHRALIDYFGIEKCKTIKLRGYVNNSSYSDAKIPVTQWIESHSLNELEVEQWTQQGGWIGVVIPEGFVLVDVDNIKVGETLYQSFQQKIDAITIKTPNGYQFFFEDNGRVKSQSATSLTAGGLCVDYRLAGRGYIVLPTRNTEKRELLNIPSGELEEMPMIFIPVRTMKQYDEILEIPIYEGRRDDTLFRHACKLINWNERHKIGLSDGDSLQILNEINKYFCEPPFSEKYVEDKWIGACRYKNDPVLENSPAKKNEHPVMDSDIFPVVAFPFDIFPKDLLGVIDRLSNAQHVEPEIVASIMLALMSGAIGNTIKISPKRGYEVAPFIWLIIIAPSGYGKSPVMKNLFKHINQLQAKEFESYKQEYKNYEMQLKKSQKEKDAVTPEAPKLKQYHVSDSTVEALADVYENHGRGIIIYQDEIAGLIFGLDQYKGKGNDRQHYLELFNCDSWKINRKAGVTFIQNTGASIIGGIQPGAMPRVFKADTFDDGLLPRFLLLNTKNKPKKFSRQEITKDDIAYWIEQVDWCYRIELIKDEEGFIKPDILILSDEALDLWETFYNDYGSKQLFLSGKADVFIPKLSSYYCLKFAGVLHCIKAFCKHSPIISSIDEETIQDAIMLTNYFTGQAIHALDLYEKSDEAFNEFQKRLINILHNLQEKVEGGKLPVSMITSSYNKELSTAVQLTPKKIGSLLDELSLNTEKSTGNYSYLLWEDDKIQELFRKAKLTKVTTVTEVD